MSTEPQKFIHDDGPAFREMIRLVGRYLVDPAVTKQLGCQISTKPGDIWLIAKNGASVTGFCIITLRKDSADLHGLWVMPYTPKNGLYYSLVEKAAEEVFRAGRKRIRHVTWSMFREEMEKDEWECRSPWKKFLIFTKHFPHHYKISSSAVGSQNP